MDNLAVVLIALVSIGLIVWWFFGKRQSETVVADKQDGKQVAQIIVDGGYKPGIIELEKGVPTELTFIRKDTSSCFEEVVLPDFGISTHLPINKPYIVSIMPNETGEYTYACGMNMFFGKVVVK